MEFNYTKEPGKYVKEKGYNKKEKPLLSIITPYYNASKYFEQTYNSVLNQTFPWYEWIVINDGSTEDTMKLEELCSKDERIKLINKENGGLSSARNRAIQESTTDIIIPLDSDDLIEETYVEKVYFGLYFNKEASFAYTDSLGFSSKEYLWKKKFDSDIMKEENILTYCSAIRKEALIEVGCYDIKEQEYNEDWRTWLKLLSKGKKPVHIAYYGFWYRRLDDGMLSRILKDKEKFELSRKYIKEIAVEIKEKIEAIEYPRVQDGNRFKSPQKSKINLKRYDKKEKHEILMIIPWMQMGGADIFNLEFIKKIDKDKYNISIITTVYDENIWRQRFEDYTKDIFELPSFLDIENYPEFISYYIESRQIDTVLISNSYYGYYISPWIRKEYPNISIIDYVHAENWYWRNGGYARTSSALSSIVEKTYVCNERTRKVLIEKFNRKAEDVKTIYVGVDKEKYKIENTEKLKIKEKFNIQEKKIVLFPCRIHPEKRPFLMLEIAKEIKKRNKNIAFVVVGEGLQLEELKNKSRILNLEDTVYFAGAQKDMLPYYADSDITLICSLKEGISLVAYESLSMGVPVISSDVGGQKELIDDKVGFLIKQYQDEEKDLDNRDFDKEEIQEYADVIEEILGNKEKHKKMKENCRKKIELGFSTDSMIKHFEKELEDSKLENRKVERENIANKLKDFKELIDDYMTIYSEFEILEKYNNVIWKDVLWFKELYEIELNKNLSNNNIIKENIVEEDNNYVKVLKNDFNKYNKAFNELEHIYSMRSWKLISKYRYFMDETFVGKKLKRILYIIRK